MSRVGQQIDAQKETSHEPSKRQKNVDNSGIKPPTMDEQGIEPWTTPK
jgi:hypothetical protein